MPLGFVDDMASVSFEIAAEERLEAIMDMAAATGHLKKQTHRGHIRDLRRQAAGTRKRTSHKKQEHSGAAMESVDAASFGIQVVYVNPAGEEVPRPGSVKADA